MLDAAFEALSKLDWGMDLGPLAPIEDAVVAARGDSGVARDLEQRLTAALGGPLTLDGKEYVCRKLAVIGTAASVPALAALLTDQELSHMARFALERIPAPECGQALREALPQVQGNLKIGVISTLGSRREAASVPALTALLKDENPPIARSAALALGTIGSSEAAAALKTVLHSAGVNPSAVIDGLLSCAESLLAQEQRAEAVAIYQAFAQDNQPRLVRLAGMRGLLACSAKPA